MSPETFSQFLQLLLEAVIAAAVPVLAAVAVQYLRAKYKEVGSGLDGDTQYFIEAAVEMAVRAAEQSGLKSELLAEGVQKKAFALEAAEAYLARYGITLDLKVLDAMIEAEVWKQFNSPATDND